LPQMLEACAMIYPGLMTVIERMLPTYSQHAARRATEMSELEQTSRNTAMEPCLIGAIRQLHEQMANLSFDAADTAQGWTAASLVEYVVANGLLAAEPSADQKKPA